MEEIEKKLNRYVLRSMIVPTLISLVIGMAVFVISGKSEAFFVPPLLTLIFDSVFSFNRNYLIKIDYSKPEDGLIVIYYNFLDKLKREKFQGQEIVKMKLNKRKTLTKIELKNYRTIVLHHVYGITEN
jgi:hypothetical protein